MSNINITGTLNAKGLGADIKKILLDYTYPIGSIFLSIDGTSPASFLGGTWEQLQAGYALWTASEGAGNKISAGLPNITGNATFRKLNNNNTICREAYGAMSTSESGDSDTASRSSTNHANTLLSFDASRSNAIYGASTTVQPPAIKVYAWKRTS